MFLTFNFLVNVFLPSLSGTKTSFLRDILADKKSHFKQNEVNHMQIPAYAEISVKGLYDDAMGDPQVAKYLPSAEQLGGKLPERDFFFGILCTVRTQFMKDIIEEAHNKRFKVSSDEKSSEGIALSDAWFKELTKHPYHSSKSNDPHIYLEKPGTGIFLMREKAKLQKASGERQKFTPSKRLSNVMPKPSSEEAKRESPNKKLKGNDGKPIVPQSQQDGDQLMKLSKWNLFSFL